MNPVSLLSNNPYFRGYVLDFKDGEPLLETKYIEYVPDKTDKYHLVTSYDTLDMLAYQYYGDSKLFWVIASSNKIINPFELTEGTTILIPDKNRFQAFYNK